MMVAASPTLFAFALVNVRVLTLFEEDATSARCGCYKQHPIDRY
jgi:hypothetical protein